jgi:regulation of enolase protein 1 (concanavalin A-like superfamily)
MIHWNRLKLSVSSRKARVTRLSRSTKRMRLQLERLEPRTLMASDITNLSSDWLAAPLGPYASALETQDDDEHGDNHQYAADTREPTEVVDENHWALSLDTDSLNSLLALSTPSVIGRFTQQTLSFTTIANGMPILNSLVGSPTSVFLDFDGDTTTNTQAYDVDGDPLTFNAAEQKTIAEAWRHIAIYFSNFDTDVTTIQPATAQPKVWAAIGNNIVGGYCGVNVFPNTQPRCFNNSGDARTRQSGIAHEVGHNFGLSHQSDFDLLGAETADYSSGYDQLHVPIMGVDFAQRVRKFVIGHTSNASILQDDVAVIASKIGPRQSPVGDGFRADDFSGTIATATALTSLNDVQYASGIIERLNDVDAFSFVSNGQAITVSALADFPSGLDIKLEIYDALGVLVAAKDAPTLNDQEITLVLPSGTYYALVSSHGNYGDIGTYNIAVRSLPTGWTAGDVGVVGVTGFSQFHPSTNSFVLGASGADITQTSTSDEMQFARQTLTGDGTIIARVTSLVNTTGNAKAGIEIRETLAGGSKHVALTPTPTGGVKFIRRATTGGNATTTTTAAAAFAPVWVRLQRVGNVFTASTSPDGATWTTVGTPQTIAMNASVQIGLVATAQNDRLFTAAEFENVSITGSLGETTPLPNSLPAPTGVTVTRATGSGLAISWTDQASETGYRVERSIDGVTFTTAGTTAANVTTFEDPGLVGTMRYFYQVRALNASGASVPSAIVSELNRPSAIGNLELTAYSSTQLVLDWIETSGETGYRIERSPDGVTYTTIATVGANIPSYTSASLTAGTTYFYRVTPTSVLGDGPSTDLSGGTRLAAVAGLTFSSIGGNAISLAWTDHASETGYRIMRSTNGTTFTDLATVAAGATTYTDSTVTPGNEYYYRVLATAGLSVGLFHNALFTATPTIAPLPSPWTAQDIGPVSGSGIGSTTYSGTTFRVVSSGTAITGTTDSFRYTHQRLNGDGSITARIATLEDTAGGSTRFGVMFRDLLTQGSRYAMMTLREGNTGTAQFSSRTTVGVASTVASDIVRNAPYWVRVTRAGNLFTGATSADGVTWTDIGSATIAMPSLVYVGLAASAGINSELNTATATNVSVVGDTRNAVIAGRQVFYNNAGGFGTSGANNATTINPTNAIDPTKIALLPGQTTVTTDNYTNYSRGLNGIVIDLSAANNLSGIDASSFQFATWTDFTSSTPNFVTITPTVTVSSFATGGVGGSGRLKLVFPDNVIQNAWLRVTVLANANSGLIANDVFYFGNGRFDVTPATPFPASQVIVNVFDTNQIRAQLGQNAGVVSNIFDVDRSGVVNIFDVNGVRSGQGVASLRSFTAPSSQSPSFSTFAAAPIVSSRKNTQLGVDQADAFFADLGAA